MSSSSGSDRATKLHDAFDKALSKWTQSFSFEQFASCFPALFDQKAAATEQNAALLHSLYIALVSRFIDNATQEFAVIVRERDIVNKLNALDAMQREQKSSMAVDEDETTRTDATASTNIALDVQLNVDADAMVRAQSIRLKRDKIAHLQRAIHQLTAEHKRLLNELQSVNAQGRTQIDTLVGAVQQLEQCSGAVGESWRASETRQWFESTFQK